MAAEQPNEKANLLIEKYFLGNLTEEESTLLREYLSESKELRDRFRIAAKLDSQIRNHSTHNSINFNLANKKPIQSLEKDGSQVTENSTWQNWTASKLLLAIACSTILAVAGFQFLWNPAGNNKETVEDPKGNAYLAKTIVSSQCHFSSQQKPKDGKFPPGKYRLNNGAVSLLFDNGVEVAIEGPAEFELIDSLKMVLERGRARAVVPDSGHGFVINTPQGNVEDLGTEFGVFVGEKKKTEVHVFAGEVRVHKPNQNPVNFQEDTAVNLTENKNPKIKTDDDAFLTKERIGFRNWLRQSQKLQEDSAAIVYFPFLTMGEDRTNILNQSESNNGRDGKVVGGYWASGRWSMKKSIHFEQQNARIELNLPAKMDKVTMFFWVRVDRYDKPLQTIFNTRNWEDGKHHWNLTRNGASRVGIYENYVASLSQHPVPIGKWTFLAATLDRENGETIYFVNGKKVNRSKWNSDKPISFGPCSIGSYGVSGKADTVHYNRELIGRIDEFGLFQRIFSEKEIKEIYQNGNGF